MLTIIEIAARPDGGHGLQSQSHRTACWLEGWIEVPPQLEQAVWDCRGYCQLEIQDGVLTGVVPGQPPAPPEAGPDTATVLNTLLGVTENG
ncbi:toxin-antitoxin system toxin subunit [uncultured Flavonifractor sp.]|uniref:toxin-antitoxin system toxin subunit n=1 Tax=uncultured Flavonifractor sp. TaxID=1193534 RepID=UPI00260F9087|nr:toxin-antitoxin system toxin subunit [uncultured Flavonifractor sp.]